MLGAGPDGIESAVATLRQSSDERLKEAAAYAIGESGKKELAQVLADGLADSSEQFRRAAITALQKLINPEVLKLDPKGDTALLPPPGSLPPNAAHLCSALQPLLSDRSPLVRAPAAETLGWLRCNSSIAGLRQLMHDPIERVRYRGAHALERLTGRNENFIDLDSVILGRPPVLTVGEADGPSEAQQAGPFLRTAFFERQGAFSYRGGIPAQFQTVLRVWSAGRNLEFEAECQDESTADEGEDLLTFYLRPQGQSKIFRFDVDPGRGLVRQAIESADGSDKGTELNAHAFVERGSKSWKAHLEVPFESFGTHQAPAGEIWEANVVRTESHRATGWGPEVSSWTYFDRDFPGPPRMGSLYFSREAPGIAIRPPPENAYTYPFDRNSLPGDQNRPVRPLEETLWGNIVAPDQLIRGTNAFFLSQRFWKAGQPLLKLTVVASDDENGKRIVAQSTLLPDRQGNEQRAELNLPKSTESRAIDLEFEVSSAYAKRTLFRTSFLCVPLVSPPRLVTASHLSRVEDEKNLWKTGAAAFGEWAIRDFGPMLMSESYPMALTEGRDGMIYGGTYPGGRLFSFNPVAGIVEDLGSPSPPANHLASLVTSPDGDLFGDLHRPRGRVFSFDLKTRSFFDWGVPVPGAFSGEGSALAWSSGRAYGTERGHLFYTDSATGRVVDKGNFYLDGQRFLPMQVNSDIEGNILGIAGGRLFQYLPGSDEVHLSDVDLDGWFLPGPQGKLYALFQDGRLYRWEPEEDALALVARYAPFPLDPSSKDPRYRFRGLTFALANTGELVLARSGIDEAQKTALSIYAPDGSPPVNLGNPVAGSFYLTALTSGTGSTVYGLSTQTVYGLGRTPVHLYSLTRADRKKN